MSDEDNHMTALQGSAQNQLRQLIEQIERLEREFRGLRASGPEEPETRAADAARDVLQSRRRERGEAHPDDDAGSDAQD